MLIALASLDPSWEDRDENLRRCAELTARAADAGAQLIAFPELTLTGFTMNAEAVAEPAGASPSIDAFLGLARRHAVHIAFGVALRGERLPRNTLAVVGPVGELGRYGKLHPFSHAGEHEHYEPGDAPAIVRVGGLAIGLTVCYDLRFPELYSALAPQSDAILVIASWPGSRIEHWRTLTRARAIDNQCYIVAVNRTGSDADGVMYPHSSFVVAPCGDLLQPCATDGVLDLFTVDAAAAAQQRRSFPTLRDRRNDLYRRILPR